MRVAPPGTPFRTIFCLTAVLVLHCLAGCGVATSNDDRLNRAEAAIASGDYRAAIIDVKSVLSKDADNARARLLLARASLRVGDSASAEKQIRRAVELGIELEKVIVDLGVSLLLQGKFSEIINEITVDRVTEPEQTLDVLRLRADAYLGLGKPDSARELFASILDRNPEYLHAELGIVSSYLAEQEFLQARDSLDEVLTTNRGSPEAWLASGKLNHRLRSFQAAERDFRHALTLAIEQHSGQLQLEALAGLSMVLFALDRTEEAREYVEQLSSIAPNSIPALQMSARAAYVDADWPRAQQDLQRILQRVPQHRPAQLLLGAVHLRSGNLAMAEMYLSAVVAASPNNMDARRLLAETHVRLDRLAEARETLLPIVDGPEADASTLFLAGRVGIAAGDHEQATEFLDRSLAKDPKDPQLQFGLAAAYISVGQLNKANDILENLRLETSETNQYWHEALNVILLLHDGNADAALVAARRAAERWPEMAAVHHLLGNIELTRENYEAARTSFERAARLASGDLAAVRQLATVDEAQGRYEAARQRYLHVLEIQPDAVWAMVSLARIAARSEDPEQAVHWLELARGRNEAAVEPGWLLARLQLAQGNLEAAERAASEAVARDQDNAMVQNVLGLVYLAQREFRQAERRFKLALNYDTDNSDYRLNLARAQTMAGDLSAAKATLENAEDFDVSNIRSVGLLISIELADGNVEDALRMADRLQARHPTVVVPLAFEAEIHLRAGDSEAAVEAYRRALGVNVTRTIALRAFQIMDSLDTADKFSPLLAYLARRPLDNSVRIVLAQSYQQSGVVGRAVAEYEKIIESEPSNAVALNNLAWLYLETGDEQAEQMARRAYQLEPTNKSIADTLGWILIQKGSVESGVKLLQAAVTGDGNNAETHYHLAVGLARLGRNGEARQALENILSGNLEFNRRDEAERLLTEL